MKIPKSFNKMSKEQQEEWLVAKLNEVYKTEDEIKRLLGSVRGGKKLVFEIDRVDEIILKEK